MDAGCWRCADTCMGSYSGLMAITKSIIEQSIWECKCSSPMETPSQLGNLYTRGSGVQLIKTILKSYHKFPPRAILG